MRFIPFALCLFFHVFAHADWAAVESTAFPLQDPPVAGSKAEKADFIQLHQYQDNRTQETCDFAALQRIPTFTALFGNASGLTNSQDIQCLNPLFTKIFKLTERVTGYYKRKYTRSSSLR